MANGEKMIVRVGSRKRSVNKSVILSQQMEKVKMRKPALVFTMDEFVEGITCNIADGCADMNFLLPKMVEKMQKILRIISKCIK